MRPKEKENRSNSVALSTFAGFRDAGGWYLRSACLCTRVEHESLTDLILHPFTASTFKLKSLRAPSLITTATQHLPPSTVCHSEYQLLTQFSGLRAMEDLVFMFLDRPQDWYIPMPPPSPRSQTRNEDSDENSIIDM